MNRHHTMRLLAGARPARLDPVPGGDLDTAARRAAAKALMAAQAAPDDRSLPGLAAAGSTVDTGPPGRRRQVRWWALITAVPATAAVTAVVVLVLSGGLGRPGTPAAVGGSSPGASAPASTQAAAPRTARELLLVAAGLASTGQPTTGSYWRTVVDHGSLTEVGPAGDRYRVMHRIRVEAWQPAAAGAAAWTAGQSLGAAPFTPQDEAAWRRNGSPTSWTEPVPPDSPAGTSPVVIEGAPGRREVRAVGDLPMQLGGQSVTMAELAALPTDPVALRADLLRRYASTGGTEPQTWALFWAGTALVLDLPASPQLRAAAYRMLADLEAVSDLGQVTDPSGRRGVAIGYLREGDGGWVQYRLVVDATTGRALASETWDLGHGSAAHAPGLLMSSDMLVDAGWRHDTPR